MTTLRFTPLCTLCGESAALVEMPEPPAFAIPEVLEYAVRAIVRWLARKSPEVAVDLMIEEAKRGRWRPVIAESMGLARTGGVVIVCQSCVKKGWADARD
jgi:hypothetical protein